MLQYLTWCQGKETMNSKSSDKKASVYEKKCLHGRFFTLGPASFFGSVRQSNKQILPCGTLATFSGNIQLFLFLSMRPLMDTFFFDLYFWCMRTFPFLLVPHAPLVELLLPNGVPPHSRKQFERPGHLRSFIHKYNSDIQNHFMRQKTIGRFNRRTKIP